MKHAAQSEQQITEPDGALLARLRKNVPTKYSTRGGRVIATYCEVLLTAEERDQIIEALEFAAFAERGATVPSLPTWRSLRASKEKPNG